MMNRLCSDNIEILAMVPVALETYTSVSLRKIIVQFLSVCFCLSVLYLIGWIESVILYFNAALKKCRETIQQVEYAEIGAALTMLVPFFTGLWFYCQPNSRTATKLASLGCMLHAPFSMALHIHRATYSQDKVRTWLYKLDIAFMHVNMMLIGYAWSMRVQIHQLVYHFLGLLHLAYIDPLINPQTKSHIDIITAACFIETWFGLLFRAWKMFVLAVSLASIFFLIHNQKILGKHSSSIMHILVTVPEFLLMWCLHQNIEPQWGYM